MNKFNIRQENEDINIFRALFGGFGNGAFIEKSKVNFGISGNENGNDNERYC